MCSERQPEGDAKKTNEDGDGDEGAVGGDAVHGINHRGEVL